MPQEVMSKVTEGQGNITGTAPASPHHLILPIPRNRLKILFQFSKH